MERYKYRTVIFQAISWGHTLGLLWCLYPFSVCLFWPEGFKMDDFCKTGILLIIPIAISWYVAKRMNNLFFHIITGLIVSVGYSILNGIVCISLELDGYKGAVFSLILSLYLFFARGYGKIKRGREENEKDMEIFWGDIPSPMHWIYFAVHYTLGVLYKVSFYWHMVFGLFLFDIFLCFIFRFFKGFYNFQEEHRYSANLPVKTMQKVTGIIFCIGCITLSAFALPSILYNKAPLENISSDENMNTGKRMIEDSQPEVISSTQEEWFLLEKAPVIEEGEKYMPSKWMLALTKMIVYLLCIGGILVAFMLFYHFCKKAGGYFASGTEDEISFLKKELPVHTPEKTFRQRRRGYSVNMNIRRLYKKVLYKEFKELPGGSETPYELEEVAGIVGRRDHLLLHCCYEKARYSDRGCTQEEESMLKKSNFYKESK